MIEIFGVITFCLGILLFITLITYSPSDPNFIFPENTEINNLLGFQGSYISDLFIQSVGLIAYLIPITFIFTGINIFRNKELFLLLENTFYIVIYILFGSLFFDIFYKDTFIFYINGNGGFVGSLLNKIIFKNILPKYNEIFYYILIFLIFLLFLKSINFNPKSFIKFISKIIKTFSYRKEKNYTNKDELINEYIPQDQIKNLIQEDLPFIKAEANQSLKNYYGT